MILDTLTAAERYIRLHPGFPAAFEYLQSISTGECSAGRQELAGERLFASIAHSAGRGRQGARLEVHRRYIDIQVCLAGHEAIGWRPLAECAMPEAPFDASGDIQFFADRPESWLELPPGRFAIFYPDDAHAPLAGEEGKEVLKVVIKVAVDWDA